MPTPHIARLLDPEIILRRAAGPYIVNFSRRLCVAVMDFDAMSAPSTSIDGVIEACCSCSRPNLALCRKRGSTAHDVAADASERRSKAQDDPDRNRALPDHPGCGL
jgi:hypothetical protein